MKVTSLSVGLSVKRKDLDVLRSDISLRTFQKLNVKRLQLPAVLR